MPYKKRYQKNCPTPWFGKADRYAGVLALKYSKRALSLLNVEFKNHDVTAVGTTINLSPIIIQLTNIAQGDTGETRDGSQVKLSAFLLKFDICGNVNSTNTLVRVMLVWDKQTNQAIYGSGDLLEDTTDVLIIQSPYNLDNKWRFKVLYDKVFRLSSASNNAISIKKYFKMSRKIRFDNSTSAIADLTSGSLSLVFFGNQSTNKPVITYFNRVRYIDN